MQLLLQLKRLGKKRVMTVPYLLEQIPATLRELIHAFVTLEVTRYNQQREELPLLAFLTPQQIGEQAEQGKISFGDLENRQTTAVEKALDSAVLAFEDGLFAVVIDGVPIKTLDAPIQLENNAQVAFIRLTFLAGRLG